MVYSFRYEISLCKSPFFQKVPFLSVPPPPSTLENAPPPLGVIYRRVSVNCALALTGGGGGGGLTPKVWTHNGVYAHHICKGGGVKPPNPNYRSYEPL